MQIDLHGYDKYIVYFSGGKDSLACLLHLLDSGVPKAKIELWHHLVDGREGSELMDWPITDAYCQAVADHFQVPLYFSWLQGGFEGEMNRKDRPKAATSFEVPRPGGGKEVKTAGGVGKPNTRERFPQVSANLAVRWCSSSLKIDVGAIAIRNQERFNHSRTLTISGERAEESPARSKYSEFEPDRTDRRNGRSQRHVDRWRPVHKWCEQEVWEIIGRHKVIPHPAYSLGWGRVSCLTCIFGSSNQWASVEKIAPQRFDAIADYEEKFGCTIDRKLTVKQKAEKGVAYSALHPEVVELSQGREWATDIVIESWALPVGAFAESCGPT